MRCGCTRSVRRVPTGSGIRFSWTLAVRTARIRPSSADRDTTSGRIVFKKSGRQPVELHRLKFVPKAGPAKACSSLALTVSTPGTILRAIGRQSAIRTRLTGMTSAGAQMESGMRPDFLAVEATGRERPKKILFFCDFQGARGNKGVGTHGWNEQLCRN